ncbi:MAG TPA: hypothetical protein VMB18_18270 [Terriglobales bacterium]|nr:hypothetical protein [Terriglobales bacterium]
MRRVKSLLLGLVLSAAFSPFLLASSTEVLYVVRTSAAANVLTYNVDPNTGLAIQIGAVALPSRTLTPLWINGKNFLYVWDSSDLWVYPTDAEGLPNSQPIQHLLANFTRPITSFVVDPMGHYAYAVMSWIDSNDNYNAQFVLFTIDAQTGKLTDTGDVVATYGPDPYKWLASFGFGVTGTKLWTGYTVNAPFTCIVGYDYYPVWANGRLGPQGGGTSADCGGNVVAVAASDTVVASAQNCCGPGAGELTIASPNGDTFECSTDMQAVCGDVLYGLSFDPTSRNLFIMNGSANQIEIARVNFAASRLVLTPSVIPLANSDAGSPWLLFSPDARLVYAVNRGVIEVYVFAADQGDLITNQSLVVQSIANVVTTTLPN